MTATNRMISLILALGAAVPAGAAAQGIQVVDAWSRPTPPGMDVGVAYFVIRNAGKSDRLLRVSSPVARSAELHVSAMKDGVAKMEGLASVDVAGGAPVAFEPSGRHVMLVGLKHPLKAGDVFPLTLTFANAGRVRASVRVRGAEGEDKGHSGASPGMMH
ncbi:MAG TPA: copper chaperone PCu(A)C [Burkholderiales bacterium]|nr:copper chaperone PCu(A)C [Burkholderiales bacterium]